MGIILLPVAVLVPTLLILWWRAHGPLMFMSVCLGYVLTVFVAPDVVDFLVSFFRANEAFADEWTKLALLLVPVVLTLLFTARSVKKNRLLLNLIPAVTAGALLTLLAVPLLPSGWQAGFTDSHFWNTLQDLRTDVLLGGGVFSLLYLFVLSRAGNENDKKKKHE